MYGSWSNWTDCGSSCKQKRFRYCFPGPINGGRCLIGLNPQIDERDCPKCERNDTGNIFKITKKISFARSINHKLIQKFMA